MQNLKFIAKIVALCFVLIDAVSSIPQKYKASDGRDYIIETEQKYNWFKAFHECARRDLQLLIIDSDEKNKVIIDLLKKVIGTPLNLWLGGNDEFSTSNDLKRPFYWSATGQTFSFTYWYKQNPDNYLIQEHCVHIWENNPDFQWNDVDCTNNYGFICEPNHYLEKYQNDFKSKCAADKQATASIIQEFTKAQQQQLSEIAVKLEKIDTLEESFKIFMQQCLNASHIAVEKVIDNEETKIKQFTEDISRQVSVLSAEIKKFTPDISTQIAQKLNDSVWFPVNIKNFIAINQND